MPPLTATTGTDRLQAIGRAEILVSIAHVAAMRTASTVTLGGYTHTCWQGDLAHRCLAQRNLSHKALASIAVGLIALS
jgi:hypothetical protein